MHTKTKIIFSYTYITTPPLKTSITPSPNRIKPFKPLANPITPKPISITPSLIPSKQTTPFIPLTALFHPLCLDNTSYPELASRFQPFIVIPVSIGGYDFPWLVTVFFFVKVYTLGAFAFTIV
jgi:hypothetical protein